MRILAADIGGTNSRFALFEAYPLRLLDWVIIPSASPDFLSLLDQLASRKPELAPERADIFVPAVAGPVDNQDRMKPSNLPYMIDMAKARQVRGFQSLMINDFTAQAWACLTSAMDEALPLLPLSPLPQTEIAPHFSFPPHAPAQRHEPCALVGAGTGLGMAVLVAEAEDSDKPWQQMRVIPSEGGHAVFPFVGEEEQRFADFAAKHKRLEYLRLDDIVTGPGLALLHLFLTGENLEPRAVTCVPGFEQSKTCAMFAAFYGRVCRNMALTCLPGAGLVVTGGLAANCPALVQHPAFRRELDNAPGEHYDLLRAIPFWHNANQFSGLWGAAMAGWAAIS